MTFTTDMQLNKLGYNREREVVEFSMRRSFDNTAIVINGEVPVMMLSAGDIRGFAKAAVRQALLDAAAALAEPDDTEDDTAEEGTRPEDLNAANDD
ncbi:hypothetical protein [Aliihoeflea sp. PC F10.4]